MTMRAMTTTTRMTTMMARMTTVPRFPATTSAPVPLLAPLFLLALLPATHARADLLMFNNRADFDLSTSGVVTETFQSGKQVGLNFPGPLDSTSLARVIGTGAVVFAPGDIAPGVTFDTLRTFPFPLRLRDVGNGNGDLILSTPSTTERLIVDFAAPVTAAALDVYQSPDVGAARVDAFAPDGSLLGTVRPLAGPTIAAFVGFAATDGTTITRLVIDDSSIIPGIDDVSFGTLVDASRAVAIVPEPGSLGPCGVGMGLVMASGWWARGASGGRPGAGS